MPVDYRNLVTAENSVEPTASITGKLGGRSTAEGGEIDCFDVDEGLQKRKEIGAKRARFIWSEEHHQIFVDAVNTLTLERAVPRKILEYMRYCGVQNITRPIVASHLQKYRLNLKKSHLEVDKASKLPSQSISFNATKRKNPEESMRNQEENMRNQEENMRNQVLQENVIYEMTHQRWPLFESLSRQGLTQPNMCFPHFCTKNEPIHLQNLPNQFTRYVDGNNNNNLIASPNQFTRYVDGNNNNNVIASPNQFTRYVDGNNNNNVFASLINDRLSNHVSNECLYLKISREPVAFQEYHDDIRNVKPKV